MLEFAVGQRSPTFIRYPRGTGQTVAFDSDHADQIELGKAHCIKHGEEISIWALGSFVALAEEVYEHLSIHHGLKVSVVNARFIKPLDKKMLVEHANSHRIIVTMEDNVSSGGFGSAVIESLNDASIGTKVIRFAWPDKFISHGSNEKIIRMDHSLDFESIIEKILKHLDSNLSLTNTQTTTTL